MITTSRHLRLVNALVETKAIRNLLVCRVPKHQLATDAHVGALADLLLPTNPDASPGSVHDILAEPDDPSCRRPASDLLYCGPLVPSSSHRCQRFLGA
jgi:hypothetical protein